MLQRLWLCRFTSDREVEVHGAAEAFVSCRLAQASGEEGRVVFWGVGRGTPHCPPDTWGGTQHDGSVLGIPGHLCMASLSRARWMAVDGCKKKYIYISLSLFPLSLSHIYIYINSYHISKIIHRCVLTAARTIPGQRPGRESVLASWLLRQRSTASACKLAHGHVWRQATSGSQGRACIRAEPALFRGLKTICQKTEDAVGLFFFAARDRLRRGFRTGNPQDFEPGCSDPATMLVSSSQKPTVAAGKKNIGDVFWLPCMPLAFGSGLFFPFPQRPPAASMTLATTGDLYTRVWAWYRTRPAWLLWMTTSSA